MQVGSRSEVKRYLQKGMVTVNGELVKEAKMKINPEKDEVMVSGEPIAYAAYEYYILHKPAGYITATKDAYKPVVMDLLTDTLRKDLFPVGRLDIDTEGLLLITNDGELARKLLAPAKHVEKTYYAKIQGKLSKEDIKLLEEGIDIGEKRITMPAKVRVLEEGDTESQVEITITEGKYHQVKRMFAKVGAPVFYLRRISMGPLTLDSSLEIGAYRKLTEEEWNQLHNI